MAIALKGVTITFRDGARERNVLDDVSWVCHRGHVSVLMGPSGAGKTTALRVVSTDLQPDAGGVYYGYTCYTSLPRRKRDAFRRNHIVQIFQDYNLLDSLTALENVALGSELRGIPVREARRLARDAMKRLHLDEVSDAFPATLSGGERQRVGIARCMASDVDIVLADEPTGALDEKMTVEVCHALRELAEVGKHVIVVTHDPLVAAAGDVVSTLSNGTISG